eukprot:jgi/Mesen1/9803/ME000007S09855
MSYRRITLPEPPPLPQMAGLPEIFEKGISTVVRRAIIIGNGAAGSEHQSLGLVRALGLGNQFQLHRVERPVGAVNDWLRWLPLPVHRAIDSILGPVVRRLQFEFSNMKMGPYFSPKRLAAPSRSSAPGQVPPPSTSSQPAVPEANAQAIADMAKQDIERDGPLLVVASGRDTVATAAAIKALAPDCVFVVQVQHPRCDLKKFDMVVTPQHDWHALDPDVQKQIPSFMRRWVVPAEPPDKHV